jgi:hypothetical protein
MWRLQEAQAPSIPCLRASHTCQGLQAARCRAEPASSLTTAYQLPWQYRPRLDVVAIVIVIRVPRGQPTQLQKVSNAKDGNLPIVMLFVVHRIAAISILCTICGHAGYVATKQWHALLCYTKTNV